LEIIGVRIIGVRVKLSYGIIGVRVKLSYKFKIDLYKLNLNFTLTPIIHNYSKRKQTMAPKNKAAPEKDTTSPTSHDLFWIHDERNLDSS